MRLAPASTNDSRLTTWRPRRRGLALALFAAVALAFNVGVVSVYAHNTTNHKQTSILNILVGHLDGSPYYEGSGTQCVPIRIYFDRHSAHHQPVDVSISITTKAEYDARFKLRHRARNASINEYTQLPARAEAADYTDVSLPLTITMPANAIFAQDEFCLVILQDNEVEVDERLYVTAKARITGKYGANTVTRILGNHVLDTGTGAGDREKGSISSLVITDGPAQLLSPPVQAQSPPESDVAGASDPPPQPERHVRR